MKGLLLLIASLFTLSNSTAQSEFSTSDLSNYWPPSTSVSTVPLTFTSTVTSDGVTLIDTDEGSLALQFDGVTSSLNITTDEDSFNSSVDNLSFTPGLNTNTVSGENLSFTSSSSATASDIGRFSFSGGSSEFRFELQDFDTTANTNWGGNA